jgi:hypothetical protein
VNDAGEAEEAPLGNAGVLSRKAKIGVDKNRKSKRKTNINLSVDLS